MLQLIKFTSFCFELQKFADIDVWSVAVITNEVSDYSNTV